MRPFSMHAQLYARNYLQLEGITQEALAHLADQDPISFWLREFVAVYCRCYAELQGQQS